MRYHFIVFLELFFLARPSESPSKTASKRSQPADLKKFTFPAEVKVEAAACWDHSHRGGGVLGWSGAGGGAGATTVTAAAAAAAATFMIVSRCSSNHWGGGAVGGGGLASSANDNAEGVIIANDANLESFPEQNL